ncbi:MAG TPA: ROK family protein [Candidatus Acidoferrum sp.]|jgi:glucokinase
MAKTKSAPRSSRPSYRSHHSVLTELRAAGYVIGIDIGATTMRVALANMKGTVLAKWSASTKRTSSPQMVIQKIRTGVNHLLRQASIPRRSLLAVAAGAPGITDGEAGIVIATSFLKGWRNVRFARLLESALHVPAAVENDVKLAAIGEHWKGSARGNGNFVFLALGTGIAAGIFVNGQLVRGDNFAAGEVGYMVVPGTSEAPVKRGMPGSLESVIGGDGIGTQWLHACNGTHDSRPRLFTPTEIFDHAVSGDRSARSVLAHSARILAYAVYNISVVLNTSLFVLGGGIGMSAPLLRATRKILKQYDEPVLPRLTTGKLGQDAQLMGAIRLALDKANSHVA